MANTRDRIAWSAVLAAGFAAHVGMTVALTGRTHAAALVAAQALGALVVATIAAGRPLESARRLDPRARALACAGGLLAVFGPVAVLAAVRLSDAPAGSIVVFWMSGGWALLAAGLAAIAAARVRDGVRAAAALAAGLVGIAGAAGVVANWERPSTFSPLVRFPLQELAILGAGALMIWGALTIVRAARESSLDGALVWAAAAAAAVGLLWVVVSGLPAAWASLLEQPVQVAIAAVAWGTVCVALPRVLRDGGPAGAAALLVVAPVLLSGLILLEQAVGVAGPQPMIAGGVAAGAVTLAAGAVALWRSRDAERRAGLRRFTLVLLAVPLALSCVALALPAITANAQVTVTGGEFVGSWTLFGWESIAGVTVFALALLLTAIAVERRPRWTAAAGLAACAVWPLTLSVPTHVLTAQLTPGLEQYYGTEYASIGFTAVTSPWAVAAVVTCAAGFAALIVSDIRRHRRSTALQSGE
jgi:hypothetical protein